MPVLPIVDNSADLTYRDWHIIWSHMLFPTNEAKREEYRNSVDRTLIASAMENGEHPHSVLERGENETESAMWRYLACLQNAPKLSDWDYATELKGGIQCGMILHYLEAAQDNSADATINRAQSVIMQRCEGIEGFPSSGRAIRNNWVKFLDAAPLWAAFYNLSMQSIRWDREHVCPATEADISYFLACSEHFRWFGETFEVNDTGNQRRRPILEPEAAWHPSEDMELPEGSLSTFPTEWALSAGRKKIKLR